MHRTRIKICGIMRPIDAAAAAQVGADAIGMVLHADSPRQISLQQAALIVADLPPMTMSVGLFVDAPVSIMRHAAHTLALSALQLHGKESPETILHLAPTPVLKAIHVDRETLPDVMEHWREAIGRYHLANLCGFVLETKRSTGDGGSAGGNGVPNDWDYIAEHMAAGTFASLPPLIAAGGLTGQSVGGVIAALRPWAVDVSSGVESERGIKNNEKMALFAHEVWKADKAISDKLAIKAE